MKSNASEVNASSPPIEWVPASAQEVSECLLDARRDGSTLAIIGGGTAANWGADAGGSVALKTSALNQIIRYEPSDLTMHVGAGTPLSTVQRTAAEHDQRVSLDPAREAAGATIGGLLATADRGPLGLAYGGPRDLVIGSTLALCDGTLIRPGGHVIKNVAGYDLTRLMSGSLGTLAVITEIVVRLHPAPVDVRTVEVAADVTQSREFAHRIRSAQLAPAAAEWVDDRLLLRFEGTSEDLQQRTARVCAMLERGRLLDPEDERAAWSRNAALSAASGSVDTTVARALVRPSDVVTVYDTLHRLLGHRGFGGVGKDIGVGPLTGRIALRLTGDPSEHARILNPWRTVVEGRGGRVVICERPPELADAMPIWGSAPSSAPLMYAIKRAYDPQWTLGSGRFQPWFGPRP